LIVALFGACAQHVSVRPAEDSGRAVSSAAPEDASLEESRLRERDDAEVDADKAWIEQVGRRLSVAIPEHPRIQFVVVRGDPSINASASFNRVVISGGMLRFLENDDELAVVLGHEIAHITQGHVLGQTVASVVLSGIAIAADCFAPGTGRLASTIGQFFLGYYTRSQEREADQVGLRYASGAGYDPRAAAEMTQRLAVEAPEWMSAGYFANHLSSIDSAVAATREPDDRPSSDSAESAPGADESVAAGTPPSPIDVETPLVLIDDEAPLDQSGFTTVAEPIAMFPFLIGHPSLRGTDDPSRRLLHHHAIRNPVPPQPHSARSSVHTRVVR
jgi:hypothetical protein